MTVNMNRSNMNKTKLLMDIMTVNQPLEFCYRSDYTVSKYHRHLSIAI